jgi:hypothetical protein
MGDLWAQRFAGARKGVWMSAFSFGLVVIAPLPVGTLSDLRPCPAAFIYAQCSVDIGGKALTNCLKEAVSYRQYNMMEDTWVINRVKERLCYVSQMFDVELEIARRLSTPGALARVRANSKAPTFASIIAASAPPVSSGLLRPLDDGIGPGILREYVLPDYSKVCGLDLWDNPGMPRYQCTAPMPLVNR